MKKILLISSIFCLFVILSSCKKDSTTTPSSTSTTSGKISITITKLASETGTVNCNGLSVEVHTKPTYDAKVTSTTSVGTATSATASFNGLAKGKYYIMAWKDNDNSNSFTAGDYFGYVETPTIINGGEVLNYNIQMYILKN